MDERTRELVDQLKDRLNNVSDGQITEIIREAGNESLVEAKAILKGMMIQSILERALGQMGDATSKATSVGGKVAPANDPSFQTAQTLTNAPESKEQVQQEIEAIRREIAENERLLSQVKISPIQTEEAPEPPREEETGYGYYVYGIVGDVGERNQGFSEKPGFSRGIDPAYPVYVLQPSAIGHEPSAISAIVSQVSLQEFGQEALEANLNDIKWVEAKVYAHQSVLEKVLASRTLIPMKFCTIYRSESRVQEMLAQHYDDFVEALARLKGKKEWGVKVYCDGEILAKRVGEISDGVKELKMEMDEKSGGAAYFLKKKLEETVAKEVERVSGEYAQHSHERLSDHAEEAVVNSLHNREITGKKEGMILNGAYLVTEEQLTAFRAELESLKKEHGDLGLSYEMTGPWPPYNFVTIGFEEDVTDE